MTAASLFFVDTNVLLYTLDAADKEKRRMALVWRDLLWERGIGRLSWQVLNEFYANATGKLHAPVRTVRRVAEEYSYWQPVGFGLGIIQQAWHWMDAAGVPYWDSLILAAAETAGCSYLLTEDFQAGRRFADLTVVNPFQSNPGEFGLS